METPLMVSDSITSHQVKSEWMFAGAVFLAPEYVRENCAWLDPDIFIHPNIKRYWNDVKNGAEPSAAAITAQIYTDVQRYMLMITSFYDAPAFASAISEDRYLCDTSSALSRIALAITERKTEEIREIARSIFESAPILSGKIPNAIDVGLEFQTSLDDPASITLPTGIAPIDAKMGGVGKGDFIVIGGRPGMGKTISGMQIAVTNAMIGNRALYISLEMGRKNLWARLACGRAEVDWRLIKSRTATPEQIQLVKDATADLMDELEDRLLIDDSPMLTNEDVYRKVAQYRPDILVVDHLLLLNEHERGKMNEVIRVGRISRMGKIIAKQFDIPAVYLMQLNRDTEKRDNKRPQLSDIRNSGDVEQDADIVAFIYRPDYYAEEQSDATRVPAEIWLEKVRDGQAHIRVNTMLDLKKQMFEAPTEQERARMIPPAQRTDPRYAPVVHEDMEL